MKKIFSLVSAAAAVFVLSASLFATEAQLLKAAKYGKDKDIRKYLDSGLSINTADSNGRSLLMTAALSGKYSTGEFLVDQGADVNQRDRYGSSVLHVLAASKNKKALGLVGKVLDRSGDFTALDYSKRKETPVIIAVKKGNVPVLELFMKKGLRSDYTIDGIPIAIYAYGIRQTKVVNFLIGAGSGLNSTDNSGNTLMHLAVMKNDMKMVKFLTGKGASSDLKNSSGMTPLLLSAEKGYSSLTDLLVKSGANLGNVDSRGRNIMHILAMGRNRGKMIMSLSGRSVKINAEDDSGRTPLMEAVEAKRWENVKYLIDAGADFRFVNSSNETLLHRAIKAGQYSIAKLLVEKGIDLNAKDGAGRTALHETVKLSGKLWSGLAELIIQKGGKVNVYDNSGMSPAGQATDSNNTSAFIVLLKNGLNINTLEKGTDPLVLYAYKKGRNSIFKELSKAGANTSLKDGNGDSILHLVSAKGDLKFYKTLSENNPDLNITNKEGKTPMLLAIENNRIAFALELLKTPEKINMNHRDNMGRTVLHYMAMSKDSYRLFSVVKELSSFIKTRDNSGMTALAVAVKYGITKNVSFLLDSGADPNGIDSAGGRHASVAYDKNSSIMKMLVEKGADPNSTDSQGKSILYKAIEKNDYATVRFLMVKNVSVNKAYGSGEYPLIQAVEKYRNAIVKYMADSGANVNVKDSSGNTPLLVAVMKKNLEMVKYLVEKGADAKISSPDGKSLLNIAYTMNRSDIFNELIKGGASTKETFENGNTFLHLSAMGNRISFIRYLAAGGADVNSRNSEGNTPLILAAEKDYSGSVKALIDGKADVNLKDKNGETALAKSIIARNGYYSASYLVKAGANINDTTGSGVPLLHYAASNRKFSIVSLFLKNGANPDIRNSKNETLIMMLSKTPYKTSKDISDSKTAANLIKELTGKGSNPDLADKYGRIPIHIAAMQKNTLIVQALVKGGAKIDAADTNGNTALKRTVLNFIGDYRTSAKETKAVTKMIDMLIKAGADINAKDRFGRTVLTHIIKEANTKNIAKVKDIYPVLTARGSLINIADNEGKSAADYARESSINDLRDIVR